MTANLGDITSLELNWRGSYSSTYSYSKKDLVYYNGDAFECKASSSLGIPPTNTNNWTYCGRGQDLLVEGGSLAYHSRVGQSAIHSQGFGSFLMHNGIKGTLADPFVIPFKVKDWGGAGVSVNRYEVNDKIRFINPIEVERGRTYKLDQTDSTNAGHPLYLALTPKYSNMSVDTGNSFVANPLSDGTNIKYYIDGSEVTETQYHTTATFNAASTSRYIIWTVTNTPPDVIWYNCSQHNRMGQPIHINQGPNRMVTMNRMRGNIPHRKVKSLWCGPPGGWFPYMPTRTRRIGNQKENFAIAFENCASISQLGDLMGTGTATYSGQTYIACYEMTRMPMPFWFRGAKYVVPTSPISTHAIDIDGNVWQWGNMTDSYSIAESSGIASPPRVTHYSPSLVLFEGKCPGPNGRYDNTGAYKAIDIRGQTPHHSPQSGYTTHGYEGTVMVLMENGDIWTWGHNEQGNCGRGQASTVEYQPGKVAGSYDMIGACHGGDNTHRGGFFARDRLTGELWCWGANADGQLGVGDTDRRTYPVKCQIPTGRFPVKVLGSGGADSSSVGSDYDTGRTAFTFALLDDGSLYSWGENPSGILGHGQNSNASGSQRLTPTKIIALETNVRDFFITGDSFPTAVVIMKDGTIRTWGHNYYGQVGVGNSTNYWTSPQTPEIRLSKNDTTNYNSPDYPPVVDVSWIGSDGYHTIFILKADGTVYSCGQNDYGKLGRHGMADGNRSYDKSEATPNAHIWIDDDAPTSVKNSVFGQVQGTAHLKFISISSWTDSENNGAGYGLTNQGDVYSFGNGYIGEMGGSGINHRMGPQLVNITG